jgi:N-acetylneuraminic acid mutarotase
MERNSSTSRRDALRLGAAGLAGASGVVGVADTAAAQTAGAWTTKPRMPASRSDVGSAVLNGRLFVFGGITDGYGLPASAATYSYNPSVGANGEWAQRRSLPQALWGPCGVSVSGKIFSFGGAPKDSPYRTGTPPTNKLFRYTPSTGWTNLTATKGLKCPYPNWGMSGVYNPSDGLIYCFGGGTNVTTRSTATDHGVRTNSAAKYDESRIWSFDPVNERVVDPLISTMPQAKRWTTPALVTVDGKPYIHAIGGWLGVLGPTASNFRFDPETESWTERTPAPRLGQYTGRTNPVIDNDVYLTHGLFRGTGTGSEYLLACHRYDPETDSFETDLAAPRYRRVGSGNGVIGDTLYVAGGHVKRSDGFHDCFPYTEAFRP